MTYAFILMDSLTQVISYKYGHEVVKYSRENTHSIEREINHFSLKKKSVIKQQGLDLFCKGTKTSFNELN